MRICLKCGYKCDVITGKPLNEYKTKNGKEIDRLRAENKALISERTEVMEILAEAMGHESAGDHAPLTMADAVAKALVSLRKRVGELEGALQIIEECTAKYSYPSLGEAIHQIVVKALAAQEGK